VAEIPITSTAPATSRRKRSPPVSTRSRAARWLAFLMILAGALALLDGTITLLWQEPVSALIAKLRQDRLSGDLRQVEQAKPTVVEERALAGIADERARIAYLARALQHSARAGSPVGRIFIPRIGASFVVVNGTGTSELESGPGIYSQSIFPGTGFPGSAATTAIAGHRTTYLAPFRHIDALAAGNTVRLYMPYAHFTYTVVGRRVVQPSDVRAAIADVGYSRVVLSACTPLFSAEKRLLVYARLTRVIPVGPARHLIGGQLAKPLDYPLHPAPQRRLPPVLESLGPYYVAPAA
jgi:sortase A